MPEFKMEHILIDRYGNDLRNFYHLVLFYPFLKNPFLTTCKYYYQPRVLYQSVGNLGILRSIGFLWTSLLLFLKSAGATFLFWIHSCYHLWDCFGFHFPYFSAFAISFSFLHFSLYVHYIYHQCCDWFLVLVYYHGIWLPIGQYLYVWMDNFHLIFALLLSKILWILPSGLGRV